MLYWSSLLHCIQVCTNIWRGWQMMWKDQMKWFSSFFHFLIYMGCIVLFVYLCLYAMIPIYLCFHLSFHIYLCIIPIFWEKWSLGFDDWCCMSLLDINRLMIYGQNLRFQRFGKGDLIGTAIKSSKIKRWMRYRRT